MGVSTASALTQPSCPIDLRPRLPDVDVAGRLRRFGFITTNSIGQAYNRRVLSPHLDGTPPVSIVFAIPDHPWVDATDGAAVRVAMTVVAAGKRQGTVMTVVREKDIGASDDGDLVAHTTRARGLIGADLGIGADGGSAQPLRSNDDLCAVGMKTIGSGFVLNEEEARRLGVARRDVASRIRPYLNGATWLR